MKKIIYSIFSIGLMITISSCDKEALELNPVASSSSIFIHAAPGAPTVDPVIDGLVPKSSRRLSYGLISAGGGTGNGGAYIPILAGTRNIKVSTDSGRTNVFNADLVFELNKAYTTIVYDTLSAARNSLLAARLDDDLTVPTSGRVHVRFVHASPRGGAWDITFLRTSAMPNDSVTITNKAYLGASPNIASVSAFTSLPSGTYTMKIKPAGSQTVVFSGGLGTNLATQGRIFTITSAGTAQSQPLGVILARHL